MHSLVLAVCCLVSGSVHAPSGAPIAQAHVLLTTPGRRAEALTDARGSFAVSVAPGRYTLDVSARGFASTSAGPIDATNDAAIDVVLEPLDSPHLRLIGHVTVNGALALSRDAVPSIVLSREVFERSGFDRVVDGLSEVPSVTFARPDGGLATSVAAVALRGPDPSETLIALDGQLLNDGNTGDVDLSRLPIAAFSSVDLTEGLGPSDGEGSNTIGGAIDLISLRPTVEKHYAFSLATGSFGTNEGWYNATGSHGKLGYAFALADHQESGYVDEDRSVCRPGDATTCALTHLGSTISSRAALANVTWNFSDRADVSLRAFSLGNARDISASINGIDETDPAGATYGMNVGPGNAVFAQNIRAYQTRARLPLGSGSLEARVAFSNDGVDLTGGSGSGISPYDISHRDRRTTTSLSWGRTFDAASFAFGGSIRRETLDESGVDPSQAQKAQSYFLRGSLRPSAKLRVSGGIFATHYTTFGRNLDGRLGLNYDLDPSSALRLSFGTGFRAPLLIERYVFPASALPPPDQNCVITGQGNPNERPEHATEYELGYSHVYPTQANLDVSLYRTNLRDVIENYYPLNTINPGCATTYYSYPINVGNAVYEGAEFRFRQRFVNEHTFLTLQYGINAAYPRNLGATVSNPTSGGALVNNAQFLGVPQQQGSIGIDWAQNDWHAAADAVFRGKNNELNQGPFTLLSAGVGKTFGGGLDVTVAGTNLLNNAVGRYTLLGAGVPYRGVVASDPVSNAPVYGPLPTDRLGIEPLGIRLIVTVRR